jgi:predicted  nucleic acid-binding Zn-ribbon protein
MPLLDMLLPQRLIFRAVEDLHRIANAMSHVPGLLDELRYEFGGSNREIDRLRRAFVPELAEIREAARGMQDEVRAMRALMRQLDDDLRQMGQKVTGEMGALNDQVGTLTDEADEMRQVVEPLQAATERVGRLAERFPGPGRRR